MLPKIAILLAGYNGQKYIHEQILSLINQKNVLVEIFIRVDGESEVFIELVTGLANKFENIHYIKGDVISSSSSNFYNLILGMRSYDFDYYALCDQDDIWLDNKLINAISYFNDNSVQGYSSAFTTFNSTGEKRTYQLGVQTKFDYFFQSAGPGCTFLITPWLVNEVKKLLVDPSNVANQVDSHDWLIYAVCRASGRKWLIDPTSSVQYRQHDRNTLGANSGLKSKVKRLKNISNSWYLCEVLKILEISCSLSSNLQLQGLKNNMVKLGLKARFNILRIVPQARRKFYDRIFLALMIVLGLF
mgnify:CR=1 FL=1